MNTVSNSIYNEMNFFYANYYELTVQAANNNSNIDNNNNNNNNNNNDNTISQIYRVHFSHGCAQMCFASLYKGGS